MDNITTKPKLNITISNTHILTGVTKENFDKFYESVANNLDKEGLRTFHIIIEGKTNITTIILIMAPLDINVHKEPTISKSLYKPTPNVAAKKHIPITNIELLQ